MPSRVFALSATTTETEATQTGPVGGRVAYQISSASSFDGTFKVSLDGTNYTDTQATPLATGTAATNATADGVYVVEAPGAAYVKLARTAGTANVVYVSSLG